MGAIGDAIGGVFKGVENAIGGVAHTVDDLFTGNFGSLPGDLLGDVMNVGSMMNPETGLMQSVIADIESSVAPQADDGGSAASTAADAATLF